MNIPDSEQKFLADLKIDFKITIPELTEWKKYGSRIPPVGFFAENGHITKLTLYGLDLTSLPDSIGELKELRILSLSSNQLKSLPESFQNLINLEKLHLSGNKFQALPDWFGNLRNLCELNLCSNELRTLPDTFGNLENLKWIELTHNKISILPESFRNLKKVRGLDLQAAGLRSFSNIPEDYIDSLDNAFEESVEAECYLSKGNYLSKHAKETIGKKETMIDIWYYYHVSPLELAAKYASDKDSLTSHQKERLAWEGGFRERQIIEEGGVEPDDLVLAEINKRLIIKCDNGLELLK